MGELSLVKPKTAIEKKTHTTVDVIGLYPDQIKKWKVPMGQRPLRENAKVRAVAEQIKAEKGVVPGMFLGPSAHRSYPILAKLRLKAPCVF